MATSRTQQAHTKRVEQIAEETALKIAADSPLAEDVIVTIEEIPPTARRRAEDDAATMAQPLLGSGFVATRYIETLGALGAANAACVQGIVGAHMRFAGRLMGAVSPRIR
jgi:hypothetical protein